MPLLILKKELNQADIKYMQQRFFKLCTSLNVPQKIAVNWYQELTSLYCSPKRYYHNMAHVYNLLQLFDFYSKQIKQPLCFEIAIWWHDAIYEVKQKNNELKSTELALKNWKKYLSVPNLEQIACFINSTAKHQPLLEQTDVYYFLDFDLSILAASPSQYLDYSNAIWQEYKGNYPKLVYNWGRKKVLKQFLKRPRLFFSKAFYQQHEQKARLNIKNEINRL